MKMELNYIPHVEQSLMSDIQSANIRFLPHLSTSKCPFLQVQLVNLFFLQSKNHVRKKLCDLLKITHEINKSGLKI